MVSSMMKNPPQFGALAPTISFNKGSPDVVFMIALLVWDTLFMAKIYLVLHYIFMRYASGIRVQRRWIFLLGFVFAFGVGPVIAFSALTSSHAVFLLGLASIACLVFPLLLFPVLLLFWNIYKQVPR